MDRLIEAERLSSEAVLRLQATKSLENNCHNNVQPQVNELRPFEHTIPESAPTQYLTDAELNAHFADMIPPVAQQTIATSTHNTYTDDNSDCSPCSPAYSSPIQTIRSEDSSEQLTFDKARRKEQIDWPEERESIPNEADRARAWNYNQIN
jgi:hypothetical protein